MEYVLDSRADDVVGGANVRQAVSHCDGTQLRHELIRRPTVLEQLASEVVEMAWYNFARNHHC